MRRFNDVPQMVFSTAMTANQLDTDLFYRYQQNLQEFFDGAAKLTTYFAETEKTHAAA